ncbi:UDP-glucose 6-dehydrogenase TuaD [Paenibacillus montanisoli]|uniref:UDP-glucose 6-dehydrogenase n=1 Tax=Paenibacillus montanisoli TaxID=2081970 RepID=A0A328U995_9BACL|nr:UDP-glucose/GDP-mannose dehydrogenase family protein [Paenibacillus montanisoli]RAP77485.1 UDP-glucose 6-dehydrogenase [Paenibacillus montanisoli]
MKKITVIGTGYVGLVSGTCFSEIGHQVICCDIDQNKIEQLKQMKMPIYEPGLEDLVRKNVHDGRLTFTSDVSVAIQHSEIIFIAVGTPMSETGEADLTYVKAAAKMIGENLNDYKIVVTKSTVPVGTSRIVRQIISKHAFTSVSFDVASNPEFLREGSAISDCMNMDRAVIGASSDMAAKIIEEIHEPFHTKVLITDLESAEMIKYAANAFLATKISFINAIANVCELVGGDIVKVAEGMGLDSRIGNKFLRAGIGYGGSCFPKDTLALHHLARVAGYDFSIIQSVIDTNDKQKTIVIDKLLKALGDVEGNAISVLGLTFKPNTDDLRYAPSLSIIPILLNKGAKVKVFDPIALDGVKRYFGASVTYHDDVYDALHDSDACLVLTEWEEIVGLDLDKAKSIMKEPIIIDGRNCFDLEIMNSRGFHYQSIGRPAVGEERIGNLAVTN